MASVTPRQLYDQLVEQYKPSSDEDLAWTLRIPLRSIQRIKAGKGAQFDRTIKLLEAVGWLRTEPAPIELIEEYVRRLDDGERFPKRDLERVAGQADRLAADTARLAARIREGSRSGRTDGSGHAQSSS